MKLINKKIVKILKIVILSFSAIIVIFIASVEFFPDNSYNGDQKNLGFIDKAAAQLQRIGVFDLVFGEMSFRTSKEHQETLGIQTAKISNAEKKKLNSMIDETVKAQLEYYSTRKEESLEKVKDLYLTKEFDEYKEDAKIGADYFDDTKSEIQSYDRIDKMKFSEPRTYKDLPDRIGVMNFVKFKGDYVNNLVRLFIFKNINGEWKIEKQREFFAPTDVEEDMLIQKIKDGK